MCKGKIRRLLKSSCNIPRLTENVQITLTQKLSAETADLYSVEKILTMTESFLEKRHQKATLPTYDSQWVQLYQGVL